MKRKFFFMVAIVSVLIVCLSLASCGRAGARTGYVTENRNIAFAHTVSGTHKYHQAFEEFVRLLEEKSNGRFSGNIFPNTLGNDRDLFEGLQMGTIEIAGVNSGIISTAAPSIGIIDLPFLWRSSEHARAVLESDIGDQFKRDIEEQAGIIVLNFWENGFRNFTNNIRPIRSIDDIAGLKLRVMDVPLKIETFRDAFRSNPTPMGMSEVYSAMQMGVVDGHDNSLDTIYANSLFEVQRYLSISRHIWGTYVINVSPRFWNSLSPEDQAIFREASALANEYSWKISERIYQESLEALRELMVVTEFEDMDIQSFVNSVQPIWERHADRFDPELIARIVNFVY